MHEFIIFTIGGLAAAGIYAITASGLTLTYTTTGIFNWAHGAIGMVCAFAYWQLSVGWGWPTLLSMLVCLFVVAPVIGIVIEAGVMRRLEGVSEASKLVVTLAVALMLLGVAQWIWNPTTYRALPPLFNNDTLVLGSIRISYNDVTVLILALVVAIGLRLFLYRTRMGVTMRASVDDRTLTSLNGSSAIANARNAWIIGSILAALAGILIAPTLTLSASALTLLIVNAYAASVIGRLRSIPMTFVGAIILGLSIAYSVAYLPQNPYIQGFENAVPAIILFIALLILPQSRLRGHRQLRSRELAYRPTWSGTGLFCAGTIIAAVFFATTVSTSDLFSLNRMWGLAIVGLSVVPIVGYARAPLVVPADLRRHRRLGCGTPGGPGESPVIAGRGGGVCGDRRHRRRPRFAAVRHLLRTRHRGVRHHHGQLGVRAPVLQPLRASLRTLRFGFARLCPLSASARSHSTPRRPSSSRDQWPSRSWSRSSSPCAGRSSGNASWP